MFKDRIVIENENIKWAIFCYIDNIKVDFIKYPHTTLFEEEITDGIRMHSTPDIAAMKINAILGRGKKKDFWDLSELLNTYTLQEIIDFHRKKYPSQQLLIAIPEAITYFSDAEESAEPLSLKNQTWESVKKNIQEKVRAFLA